METRETEEATKNKRPGRPPGSKDKYQRGKYRKQMSKAKALYISGEMPAEIAVKLNLPSGTIVDNWAQRLGWRADREAEMERASADHLAVIRGSQDARLAELNTMRSRAFQIIEASTPESYKSAADIYLNALTMEQRMKQEALQLSFIAELAQIVKEEVRDPVVINNIALRFKRLFEKSTQRIIPERSSE